MAPVIVVKGGAEAEVTHEIDLQGWIDAGWKVKGEEVEKPKRTKKDEAKTEGGE